jgi:predicted O-methyltransferase YrrM
VEASKDFEDGSLDFIYIDANHNLLRVVEDLWHWVPKVRSGGAICGHDYIQRKNPSMGMHVVEAVNAYTQAFRIHPWFLLGRKDRIEGELREKPRSFLWIKE